MKIKQQIIAASLMLATALSSNAGRLWVIGDAASYGWSTDDATAILSVGDSKKYSGTLYLRADADFKFMSVPDWGNEEYGAKPGATMTDGKIAIAKGTNDEGYGKLHVTESANYYITVDTETMEAEIVKAQYQASEITVSSLFLVGSATAGGWDVMNGTPLYQGVEKPYEFTAEALELNAGTFKIARILKGACSWDAKYWYFRNADNAAKIALGQDGDLQWDIADKGAYDIAVNVLDNTISITPHVATGISSVLIENNCEAEYYNAAGVKVDKPGHGFYILKKGNNVQKVLIK